MENSDSHIPAAGGGGRMFAYEMETRTCACGCGGEFRVMKGSAQKYRSVFCENGGSPPVDFPRPKLKSAIAVREAQPAEEDLSEAPFPGKPPMKIDFGPVRSAFDAVAAAAGKLSELPREEANEEEKDMSREDKVGPAAEIAEAAGVAKSTIYYMLKKGKIEADSDGNFSLKEVLAARGEGAKAKPKRAVKAKIPLTVDIRVKTESDTSLEGQARDAAGKLVALARGYRNLGDRKNERRFLWMAVSAIGLEGGSQ